MEPHMRTGKITGTPSSSHRERVIAPLAPIYKSKSAALGPKGVRKRMNCPGSIVLSKSLSE